MFAELEGRKVALVDAGEYGALVALRETVVGVVAKLSGSALPAHLARLGKARPGLSAGTRRRVRVSRLQKDAEVAAFIAERIGADDVNAIRQSAIKRFGAERVPSKSAVGRFVTAHRRDAGHG